MNNYAPKKKEKKKRSLPVCHQLSVMLRREKVTGMIRLIFRASQCGLLLLLQNGFIKECKTT